MVPNAELFMTTQIGATPISTAVATTLGRSGDARQYSELAATIREAFNRRFLDRDTGRVLDLDDGDRGGPGDLEADRRGDREGGPQ